MSDLNAVPPGLVYGFEHASFRLRMTAAVFLALGLFNSLELIVLVCWTFRQWRGLYFWSLLISSFGIIPYVIGSILHYWNIVPLPASLTVAYVGFICIVPVQSLILYSRLYLVFYYAKVLRVMLDVIIAVSVSLLIPNTIAMFGSAFIRRPSWNYAYNVTERLQVTGFAVQELLISLLYIYSTVRLLRVSPEGKDRVKRIMYELLGINAFTIALDIAVIVVEYLNFYSLQICLKVFVYSIKVKLEFAVLGRLVAITTTRRTKQRDRVRRTSFITHSYVLSDFTNGGTVTENEDGIGNEQRPLSVNVDQVDRPVDGFADRVPVQEHEGDRGISTGSNPSTQRISWADGTRSSSN
ncbi:uncharacterized protein DSM5745_09335 [Aspergillus mulundensis]|uniref:DUF7703 domain-containing protein n=1 Tax=Aspergillus mulundensis TaxID=1810919 RepID=A0A3D8R099_9EURO|nr:Uncharacterized protein DSM5745_09335 [Aspergillus mulundensis]RDW67469.1 Uncharacterized protein DSM5745_09335 [Aspergillus mulundensis]